MNSLKTTMLGICTILAALAAAGKAYFDGDASTVPDFFALGVAISAGWGLIAARDNTKSSEDAGAK